MELEREFGESWEDFMARVKAAEERRVAQAEASTIAPIITALTGICCGRKIRRLRLHDPNGQRRLLTLMGGVESPFERHAGLHHSGRRGYPAIVLAIDAIVKGRIPGVHISGISVAENRANIWRALQTRRKPIDVLVFPNAKDAEAA